MTLLKHTLWHSQPRRHIHYVPLPRRRRFSEIGQVVLSKQFSVISRSLNLRGFWKCRFQRWRNGLKTLMSKDFSLLCCSLPPLWNALELTFIGPLFTFTKISCKLCAAYTVPPVFYTTYNSEFRSSRIFWCCSCSEGFHTIFLLNGFPLASLYFTTLIFFKKICFSQCVWRAAPIPIRLCKRNNFQATSAWLWVEFVIRKSCAKKSGLRL